MIDDSRWDRPGFSFGLARLVEELGECTAAAGKTQRWGLDSVNPLLPSAQQETNRDWLLREMDDVERRIARVRADIARMVKTGAED